MFKSIAHTFSQFTTENAQHETITEVINLPGQPGVYNRSAKKCEPTISTDRECLCFIV